MLAQLERQFLQADLAQARQLLAEGQAQQDFIAEHQYGQRVARLERELTTVTESVTQAMAGVALFFGGRPVVGSQGIKAAFGTRAVGQFQKLVSQQYATAENGPLSSRGRVPRSEDTQLLVTDVVRGSFGFVLQADGQASDDTSLKAAVDDVADTLSRMAAPDDVLFDEASAKVDNRQLGVLQEFFRLLDDEGATLRVVEGERDFELNAPAIQRARQRTEGLVIDERSETLEGEIIGWAEYSRRFELRLHADPRLVVTGLVSGDAMERTQSELPSPLHLHVRALVKMREVRQRNRAPRKTYVLQGLTTVPVPANWPGRGTQQALQADSNSAP